MGQVMDRPGVEDPFFDFVKKLPAEDVFSGKKKSQLQEARSFCRILVVRVLEEGCQDRSECSVRAVVAFFSSKKRERNECLGKTVR